MPQGLEERAELGSLDSKAAGFLNLLTDFFVARDRLIDELIAKNYGPSRRREELMRMVTSNFAAGRIGHVTDYQLSLRSFGAARALRKEMDLLDKLKLFILVQDPADRRMTAVWPTKKLIDFYNLRMPLLAQNVLDEVGALMKESPEN